MNSVIRPMNEVENCLDSQLWHACAGGMVQMPPVNSKVFYFPQGHAEHAHEKVDFGIFPRIPALILCRVSGIEFLADIDTDEVFAKMRLVPLTNNDCAFDNYGDDDDDNGLIIGMDKTETQEKPASFAKTLTQSDANNGGGFSVPRYCAETIFPRLDYSAEPPVQTILAKDVHGEIWKFRHIYRGTPRRHLLTTGWSNFVNQKKLVAGDSIVFLRADNGDLCVGIRRAKRGIGGGPVSSSPPSGWNNALGGNGNGNGNCASPFGGYSAFLREDESNSMRNSNGVPSRGKGRVKALSVVEAANLAANRQAFEVVYYPRASAPEFCVKATAVRAAMRVQWCPGMRFKMAFETEDSSRISWFMGTVSSVQVDDPIQWPNSPWRLLQVAWDEPDLLQNVKRVSPWLVELVSNIPAIHLSPFSPPRKKLRVPQSPDFPFIGQFPPPPLFPNIPLRPSSPLCCVSDNISAGIQGARHAHFRLPSADHLQFNNLYSGLFPLGLNQLDQATQPPRVPTGSLVDNHNDNNQDNNENPSCLLTMGLPTTQSSENDNNEEKAPPVFLLFGQPILTEQQISQNRHLGGSVGDVSSDGNPDKTPNFSDGSGSAVLQNGPMENSSDDGSPWYKNHQKSEFGLEPGHCKVFMEFENVGRTVDLTALGSYEELYGKLADMFGLEGPEMSSNVIYRDTAGVEKHTGDEPFR
ncbi:Auxin response factor 18 [Sarracenia purpurea var. burkii]